MNNSFMIKDRSKRFFIAAFISAVYCVMVFLFNGITLISFRFAILGCILMAASLVDLDIMELPDSLLIAAAVLSLMRLIEGVVIAEYLSGLIPAVILFIIVLVIDMIKKSETLGGGDIKLIGVLGLHFGVIRALLIVLFACIAGLIFALITKKGRQTAFSFGPMLAAGAGLMATIGTSIVNI